MGKRGSGKNRCSSNRFILDEHIAACSGVRCLTFFIHLAVS